MILSGVVSTNLSEVSAKNIKYYNEIILAVSIAMSALIVGIAIGKHNCSSSSSSMDFNVYARALLIAFSLVMEGFLIYIVAHSEFAGVPDSVRNLIITMLALNSVGLVGGGAYFIWGEHEESSSGSDYLKKFRFGGK